MWHSNVVVAMPQTVLFVGFQDPALQLDAVWESHAKLHSKYNFLFDIKHHLPYR
jgi:hypothetical protein